MQSIKTHRALVRRFQVAFGSEKRTIAISIQNIPSHKFCQFLYKADNGDMNTYFQSFQQVKGFTRVHEEFPIPYSSKVLAQEMETRLAKRQRIVRDLIRPDGVAAFPLKVQNIPGQVADAYRNNHPITISKTMSPAALWWLNVDQYNGPTEERSNDLDRVFELLTMTMVGFEDRGNNNGSTSPIFFDFHHNNL